jgi:predicted site-specific integrase-resolvase
MDSQTHQQSLLAAALWRKVEECVPRDSRARAAAKLTSLILQGARRPANRPERRDWTKKLIEAIDNEANRTEALRVLLVRADWQASVESANAMAGAVITAVVEKYPSSEEDDGSPSPARTLGVQIEERDERFHTIGESVASSRDATHLSAAPSPNPRTPRGAAAEAALADVVNNMQDLRHRAASQRTVAALINDLEQRAATAVGQLGTQVADLARRMTVTADPEGDMSDGLERLVTQVHDSSTSFRQDLAALRDNSNVTNEQVSALAKKIDTCVADMSAACKTLHAAVEAAVNGVAVTHHQQQLQLDSHETKLNQLEHQIAAKTAELGRRSHGADSAQILADLKRLHDEVADLSSNASAAHAAIDARVFVHDGKLRALEQQIAAKTAELGRRSHGADSTQILADLTRLHTEVANLASNATAAHSVIDARVSAHDGKLRDLEQQIASKTAELGRRSHGVGSAQILADLKRLHDEVADLASNASAAHAAIDARVFVHDAKLRDLEQQIATKTAELGRRSHGADSTQILADLKRLHDEVADISTNAVTAHTVLDARVSAHDQKLRDIEQQIASKTAELGRRSHGADSTQLVADLQRLHAEVADLSSNAFSAHASVLDRVSQQDSLLSQMRAQLAQLQLAQQQQQPQQQQQQQQQPQQQQSSAYGAHEVATLRAEVLALRAQQQWVQQQQQQSTAPVHQHTAQLDAIAHVAMTSRTATAHTLATVGSNRPAFLHEDAEQTFDDAFRAMPIYRWKTQATLFKQNEATFYRDLVSVATLYNRCGHDVDGMVRVFVDHFGETKPQHRQVHFRALAERDHFNTLVRAAHEDRSQAATLRELIALRIDDRPTADLETRLERLYYARTLPAHWQASDVDDFTAGRKAIVDNDGIRVKGAKAPKADPPPPKKADPPPPSPTKGAKQPPKNG